MTTAIEDQLADIPTTTTMIVKWLVVSVRIAMMAGGFIPPG